MFFFCLSVLAKSVIFSTYLRHEVVVLSQSRLLGLQRAPRLYPLVISGQGPDYAAHASAFTWIIMTKLKIISFYSPNNLHKQPFKKMFNSYYSKKWSLFHRTDVWNRQTASRGSQVTKQNKTASILGPRQNSTLFWVRKTNVHLKTYLIYVSKNTLAIDKPEFKFHV